MERQRKAAVKRFPAAQPTALLTRSQVPSPLATGQSKPTKIKIYRLKLYYSGIPRLAERIISYHIEVLSKIEIDRGNSDNGKIWRTRY